jgi:hypothetical protein
VRKQGAFRGQHNKIKMSGNPAGAAWEAALLLASGTGCFLASTHQRTGAMHLPVRSGAHLAAEPRGVQARRYGCRLRAVSCCEALRVDVCPAVSGGITLLGDSKVN